MLNLVMAIHCHQPVGNFDDVFERACDRCYQPVLEILRDNPLIRTGMHMSGSLLEWIEAYRPAILDLLGALVERGQVEVISGGFFEPLLSTIPVRDARGQTKKLNQYLESRFGHRPKGFWLTERIWDPGLPSVLAGTGLRYTIVDDTHFYYAGLKPDEIYGPYITEKEGKTLTLLATPMMLRYLIPFKPVEEVIAHLRHLEQTGKKVVVYGDDGEKFGLWPGTHEWVIQKGWLQAFFQAVAENAEWLGTKTPGDLIDEMRPLGRLYLPQASYEEMTEWALPPDRAEVLEDIIASLKQEGRWEEWRPFVRGGTWDNFLVKYDETNRMHKKMIFLSDSLPRDSEGVEYLWRSQCNCAYWHGVFGGLYLGHLRRAVYQNLLRAQASLPLAEGNIPEIEMVDVDKDGEDEVVIRGSVLSLALSPARGGGIFELSHVPLALNLSDVLTRRHEAYHRRLKELAREHGNDHSRAQSIHEAVFAKDKGLEETLIYDRYPRTSFLDHFLPRECSVDEYSTSVYRELGDFFAEPYLVTETSAAEDGGRVTLTRTGHVGPAGMTVQKTLFVERQGEVRMKWEMTSLADAPVSCVYGCEWNLTLFSDRDPERYYLVNGKTRREVAETGVEENAADFSLVNGPDHLKAVFAFSRPATVWFFPLMTVSMSEEGFERTYQGSSFLFAYPLELAKGETDRFSCSMRIVQDT